MKFRFWFPFFHHLYLGILFIIIGFIIMAIENISPIIGFVIIILGIIMVIDDAFQHLIQSCCDDEYHSPLHRYYDWIYSRSKIIRELNKWADKLFGARNNG